MKTRYTSLVSVKKNMMQKSERAVQSANANHLRALEALEDSVTSLYDLPTPATGVMSDFLSSRMLLDSQRGLIHHNEEWVSFTKEEISKAQEQLKLDMIEYEKFNYLELEEIKKELKRQKTQEAKDLDEIALMTYAKKHPTKETF